MAFEHAASIFVPRLCVACRGGSEPGCLLCPDCLYELEDSGPLPRAELPPGLDQLTSCASHEGVARSVLAAFKFNHLEGVGQLIAGRMTLTLPEDFGERTIMAVPASPLRRKLRGFDAAEYLALQVASQVAPHQHVSGVLRRVGTGRQRGRDRAGRLGSPPDIRSVRALGGRVLLVDDVTTTGATLSACSAALRAGGATSVSAVTFTRRL